MIILAIDYGSRKLGLAISDETELIAAPLPTIHVRNKAEALNKVQEVIKAQRVEKIVLGIPLSWCGVGGEVTESDNSKQIKTFKVELEKETGLMVDFWDETYSTKQAEFGARGRKRANADSEAARIILQEYLDHQREQ